MRQLFSRLLAVALLLVACSGAAWGDNLTVTVTKIDGTQNTKTGQESLEKALAGYTLGEVEGIEVSAGSFEWDDWYWLKDNADNLNSLIKFEVTGGIGSMADIPSTTETSQYFSSSLKELHIAKLQRVGDYALQDCDRLTSVTLPAAIVIGEDAFSGCEALTSVSLPAATKIGNEAFYGCTGLTSASLPAAIEIDRSAFEGCTGLTSVSLPAATEIGEVAFSDCTNLTSVSLPAATKIDRSAFIGCEGLTSLELGATPPSVGSEAFLGCPLVRKLKLLDADGTPLTGDALTNAISRYIAVEDGDTEDNLWYGWAFEDAPASNLSGAIDGVAFSGAASLEVAMQGKDFSKVKEVTITGGRFQLSDWDFLLKEGQYELAIEKFTIESSVERVADMPDLTFDGPRYLPMAQQVNIAKVKKIGDHAFDDCMGLTSVSLPAATGMGYEAFKGCKALMSVSLPAATVVGNSAFSGCKALTNVSLPAATEIGEYAFWICTGLTSVSLPAAAKIGESAFQNCTGLTSVSLPAATKIGEEAFKGCERFTSLQLGATPPSVESGVFAGCPRVRTLIITDAAGVPLVGEALSIAANAYDGYAGDPIDGKWKGWAIQMDSPRMGSVEIVPVDCGTVSITRKDGGEVVSQGDVLKEGAVLVVEGKPENGYRVKAITAEGAKKIGDKEWEVTAMTGKVTFTVEFEKKPEGESNNPTPVESVLLAQARLFPNPTGGQVTIDAGTTLARCEVYSSTGALLQAIESPKRVFTIDLSASPSGVYLVRLVDVNGESKTLRAVKQ